MTKVNFKQKIPVLGPLDQVLGFAQESELDLHSGQLTHIVLRTEWQPIVIPWDRVEFDDRISVLRLRPAHGRQIEY